MGYVVPIQTFPIWVGDDEGKKKKQNNWAPISFFYSGGVENGDVHLLEEVAIF